MKRICIILSILHFSFFILNSSAAVPLRWTVETSRLQPAVFDVVRGETLALEASFNSYGTPLPMTNHPCCVFWQTNGMGSAWWTEAASATSNRVCATFTPQMDPGATTVNGFLGSTGQIYRASFTLRFRHGPGASPNAIENPVPVLDLARTVVVNPPWPTSQDFAETTTVMRAELKTYVDGQIQGAGLVSPTMTTNIAESVVEEMVPEWARGDTPPVTQETDPTVIAAAKSLEAWTNGVAEVVTNDVFVEKWTFSGSVIPGYIYYVSSFTVEGEYIYALYENDQFFDVSQGHSEPQNVLSFYNGGRYIYATRTRMNALGLAYARDIPSTNGFVTADVTNGLARSSVKINGHQLTNDVTLVASDVGAAEASEVSGMQSSISTLNNGYTRLYNFVNGATNANFSATNYPPTAADAATRCHYRPEPGMDFSTVPASLQLNEYRDGAWRTVMDTRDWTVWYYRFKEVQLTNEIARLKAENAVISNNLENAKAWANRTANGVENPMTDTLVVDRPNMWLMADYEWQKCVSGSNQCFVIRAKNVALSGGANTNGFLEICDAFGKPYMRVNKSAETFADPVFSDIYFDDDDGAWYIVYGNSAKPTKGGANAEIIGASSGGGKCILYDEDDPDCPATITWPESAESHAGHWIMKAVPKPVAGVVPSKMFFGAEIKVAGKDYVEYVKEASFGAGIRVGNNVYEAVESGNTLIWQKKVD